MIQRREAPWWLGSSPIGRLNLVARTTLSRRPLSALPTATSESPYASEVSNEVDPRVQRLVDDAGRLVVVGVTDRRPQPQRAEILPADLNPGTPSDSVLHTAPVDATYNYSRSPDAVP